MKKVPEIIPFVDTRWNWRVHVHKKDKLHRQYFYPFPNFKEMRKLNNTIVRENYYTIVSRNTYTIVREKSVLSTIHKHL